MQLAMLQAASHFGGEVDPRTMLNAARRSVLFEILAASLTMTGREFSREEKEVIVSEVQTRTFLWNHREKTFENLSMTGKARAFLNPFSFIYLLFWPQRTKLISEYRQIRLHQLSTIVK